MPASSSKTTTLAAAGLGLPHQLTRRQAVVRVCRLIKRHGHQHPQALQLITLFCLQPEELLEAGLSFERVVGLEALCWGIATEPL
jgi:hypothetical protein